MPNSTARPLKMLLPLAAVLALALVWSVYWFVASGTAKSRFEAERAKLADLDLTLTCTSEDWGGFPFHFEFTCTSPVVKLEDRAEVSSSKLLLTALAYAPWQIVALLDGPSTVIGRGIAPTRVGHQRAIAAFTFDKDWRLKLSAEIPALDVPDRGTASEVMVHARPAADGGLDIAMSAENVNYQPPGKAPLSISAGEMVATLAPDRSLKIERLALQKDAVRYWGSGKLALDTANRPSGKLDTETNDLNGLLAIIEPHLDLTDDKKSGLRTILSLLGNEAKAPVIARDGVLYIGPFKVTEIQPLF